MTGSYITSCVMGNYTLNLDIDLQLYTSETCSMKEKNNNKDYMTNIKFVTFSMLMAVIYYYVMHSSSPSKYNG